MDLGPVTGGMMRQRWIVALVGVALVGGGGWYMWSSLRGSAAGAAQKAEKLADDDRPVPITSTLVEARDQPISVDAIGTVQAFNTVTVRSRIDGQLIKISFQEGQDVKAGDVLAQIDPRPLHATLRQMEANLQKDQAQLVSAEADLKRFLDLSTRQYATRQSVDAQQAAVGQLKAAIEADKALIDAAKTQLDYATITAPISGRTGLRQIDQGNIIRASDATGIVTITQVQPISVLFTVPEIELPAINRRLADMPPGHGLPVTAYDRSERRELAKGELILVDNQIDTQTGTIKLKASFANETRALWPGQFVTVRLHLDTARGALVIPSPVVQQGPKGSFVYVVKADRTVEARPIKITRSEDGITVIADGLKAGEEVVLDGQYRLRNGSKVELSRPGGTDPLPKS